MIDKRIRDKIEALAYEKWEWRKENGISGCALGDWLEAEAEITIDRRMNNGCPKCHFRLLARKDDKIICLKCDFEIEAKRKLDEDIADFNEIKKIWE